MDDKKIRVFKNLLTGIAVLFCLVFLLATNLLAQNYGLGDIPLHPDTYKKHLKVFPDKLMMESLPLAYDARVEGIVTSAKNQGSCGSCWAFASVGAMESHLLKTFGFGPNDLSEQQQVSCNTSMAGCCGGSSTAILYWETKGPIYEGCFPYGDGSTGCPTQSGIDCGQSSSCDELKYRVTDWHTVSDSQFKDSLYTYGPSYWRFNVYSDFYNYWNYGTSGTVYTQTSGTYQGGHAVLLIGWDDSKGAYLCKNSWGTNSGPNYDGTFWISYSGHAQNLGFGMANFQVEQVGGSCGDGYCGADENKCSCPEDCGSPPNFEEICDDDLDNDCDDLIDCDDPDCQGTLECPCIENGTCEDGEDCHNCPSDCISGQFGGEGDCSKCFKGICDGVCHPVKDGPDCPDCTTSTYCCGDGICEGDEDSLNCEVDCGLPPECGDGKCDPGEDQCSCPSDCGTPPLKEVSCINGIDDDCDDRIDCDDPDCESDPACDCLLKGYECSLDDECCSNKCRGGKCR